MREFANKWPAMLRNVWRFSQRGQLIAPRLTALAVCCNFPGSIMRPSWGNGFYLYLSTMIHTELDRLRPSSLLLLNPATRTRRLYLSRQFEITPGATNATLSNLNELPDPASNIPRWHFARWKLFLLLSILLLRLFRIQRRLAHRAIG